MSQISTIGRYEYKKSCTLLVQLFDESVQTYQSLISSGQTSIEITVQEGITDTVLKGFSETMHFCRFRCVAMSPISVFYKLCYFDV